jgi:hypothetical protein
VPGLDPNSPSVFKELDSIAVARRAAAPNKPQYKPELLAKVKELSDLQAKLDPAFFCKPPGVPRMGPPSQIVQTPGLVVFLYGEPSAFRAIPTDGRPHRTDVDPSYVGDSVGRWEGDTRYTATVEDPEVLAQPWIMNPRTLRLSTDPADALVESPPCFERDSQHMTTNEHH